jgi:hypothetical protein
MATTFDSEEMLGSITDFISTIGKINLDVFQTLGIMPLYDHH